MDMEQDALNGLTQLKSLDMSHNNMWSLPVNSLCGSSLTLQTLNLSSNHLLDITDLGLAESSESCRLNLKELDVSRNFISSLRNGDLERTALGLQKLDLSGNRLTYLSDQSLYSMTTLEVLKLADNQLAALPPTVFNKSQQLKELHLQNNSLTLVTPELFNGLEHLVLLNLSHNAIASHLLSHDTFAGLTSLKVLDLSHNQLTDLDFLQSLSSHLDTLILDHNQLTQLKNLPSLPSLKHLSVAHNKLKEIKLDLNLTHINLSFNTLHSVTLNLKVDSLEEVLLSNNQLTTVPSSLLNSTTIKSLDLAHNRIQSLEDYSVSGLKNLYFLGLSGNQISQVSNLTFANLSDLHVLNLAGNQLEAIPQGTFDGLQQLRGLRLDGNALRDLNGIVASLGQLQWLNVSSNSLEWFDFAFVPHTLEFLDISHNEIGELGNFYHLQNFQLQTLEAGHNRITVVDELPAKRLQFVQLQHNTIFRVEPNALTALADLDSIDLRYNQIQSLEKSLLRKQPLQPSQKRGQIFLAGNPLVCDCHLEWLPSINDQNEPNLRVADLADLECQLNEKSQVSLVTQVDPEDFLCSYTTHCFDLCLCCDFYACDCRMQCPSGCTCQHDASWSKNVITCSNNNATDIPLLIPMDATELHLDGNALGHIGQQHFVGRQRIQKLFLNNSGVQSIGNNAFSALTGLRTLDLSHNADLRELRGDEFLGLDNLRELRLNHNGLVYIREDTFQPLKALQRLFLEGNLLTSFPIWRLNHHRSLEAITLAQNLWSCQCDFIAPFNDFLQAHLNVIADYEEIQCVSENAVTISRHLCSSSLIKEEEEEAGQQEMGPYHPIALISGSVVVVALFIFVGILVLFVFRQRISQWLYDSKAPTEVYESRYNRYILFSLFFTTPLIFERPKANFLLISLIVFLYSSLGSNLGCQQTKPFDLYVSYAKHDADFVDHTLAPTLEHGLQPARSAYRLCLRHRDFPPSYEATSVYDTVSLAVDSSAKILIVLSKAYLAQEWHFLKAAIIADWPNVRERLVILCIDDLEQKDVRALAPELLAALVQGPVIKWGSNGFIQKLKLCLPEPVHATFQRQVTLRSMHVQEQQQQQSVYGGQEHLYHYIAENRNNHVYHTLQQPSKLAFDIASTHLPGQPGQQSVDTPVALLRPSPISSVCHSHSLSTSSGTRLLTNNHEEYIV